MKFTLFFLALCLLGVNAFVQPIPHENMSPELYDVTEDGLVDIEAFGTLYKTFKLVLRSVKGFNCAVKWVVGIKDSATQFNSNVVLCGTTASKDVTNLINANIKIIKTANNIISYKSTICASAEDADQKVTNSCFAKTLYQLWSLKNQVQNVITLAKKLPKTAPNAGACVNDAVNTLTSYYTQFPQNITNCSKLTS
ncbi:uncharacterized protein LOC117580637 [Drosophila guanche]|uniref:Protein TsetseEP domain-containing protein n=1 Tax=Drosophila guanche TaxID=7266 RepID=A0A3B0JZ16_DROGU|nr:uncharacterized protein LOC117580637 [Drosophila guanche]SPP77971.1 Hypothetical predicted protein [Drosophila guanche]